jgi:hypothetical protein
VAGADLGFSFKGCSTLLMVYSQILDEAFVLVASFYARIALSRGHGGFAQLGLIALDDRDKEEKGVFSNGKRDEETSELSKLKRGVQRAGSERTAKVKHLQGQFCQNVKGRSKVSRRSRHGVALVTHCGLADFLQAKQEQGRE